MPCRRCSGSEHLPKRRGVCVFCWLMVAELVSAQIHRERGTMSAERLVSAWN